MLEIRKGVSREEAGEKILRKIMKPLKTFKKSAQRYSLLLWEFLVNLLTGCFSSFFCEMKRYGKKALLSGTFLETICLCLLAKMAESKKVIGLEKCTLSFNVS